MDRPDSVPLAGHPPAYDVERIRREFPILSRRVHGAPLVYLDNAASSQKPTAVIEAVDSYYRETHANVHRGAHELSILATEAYEEARGVVAGHIGAAADAEIVFVRGTTEAINLVAGTWGAANVGPGDEILLTKMEHHSNLVPWQILAQRVGAIIRHVDVQPDGSLALEDYDRLLSRRTRLVGVTHVSNTTGRRRPRTWRSTCRPWGVISTPSAGTRCSLRRASAFCGDDAGSWRPCRRGRAAER
jgi:cysteine desulfurase/selenocysteine lyase